MEYLILTKPVEKDHYDFAKFFQSEGEIVEYIQSSIRGVIKKDIRIISKDIAEEADPFDDEELVGASIGAIQELVINEEPE